MFRRMVEWIRQDGYGRKLSGEKTLNLEGGRTGVTGGVNEGRKDQGFGLLMI